MNEEKMMEEDVVEQPVSVDAEAEESDNQPSSAEDSVAAVELTIEERLAAAQAETQEFKDKWMRSAAEFTNAKRRMEKERIEIYGNALADVMAKLLPALDDYERALSSVPAEIGEHSWYEGILLTHRKLNGILEGLNIEKMATVGEQFDPAQHEAILQEPSEEYESGTIIRELQPGYRRGDRVIRAPLVVVAA